MSETAPNPTPPNKRLCLALDLRDDAATIAEYDRIHAAGAVPAPVNANLRRAGILDMEIWRVANRLVMICEVTPDFDGFGQADNSNAEIRAWDVLTSSLQMPIKGADSAGWADMQRVYNLADQP